MSKSKNIEVTLVAAGELVESIYYGPFSRYWWNLRSESTTTTELIPIRVGQKTRTFLNRREFIVRVVVGNKESAGYCCDQGHFRVMWKIQLRKFVRAKIFRLKQESY